MQHTSKYQVIHGRLDFGADADGNRRRVVDGEVIEMTEADAAPMVAVGVLALAKDVPAILEERARRKAEADKALKFHT